MLIPVSTGVQMEPLHRAGLAPLEPVVPLLLKPQQRKSRRAATTSQSILVDGLVAPPNWTQAAQGPAVKKTWTTYGRHQVRKASLAKPIGTMPLQMEKTTGAAMIQPYTPVSKGWKETR